MCKEAAKLDVRYKQAQKCIDSLVKKIKGKQIEVEKNKTMNKK